MQRPEVWGRRGESPYSFQPRPRISPPCAFLSETDSGTDACLGLDWEFSDTLAAPLDVSRYLDVWDYDVDTVTVSVTRHFW